MAKYYSRRVFITRYGTLGLSIPLGLQACGKMEIRCVDPELLGAGELQMRKTHEYVGTAVDVNRNCASCQFFRPDNINELATDSPYTLAECGHCEILSGPVSSSGFCTAFAST